MSNLYATDIGGVWATVTGAALVGAADIRRNYLADGGLVASSAGQADLGGFGVRGRLQWENAVPHLSPYGELAFTKACMGAYSETSGPFPASFDRLCSDAFDARVGVDVTVPMTDVLRIIGTLEGVHRLAGGAGNVTGEVVGLGTFSLGAMPVQSTWARAGLGLEADIGRSTVSVMGNVTTEGDSPSMWLATTVRAAF